MPRLSFPQIEGVLYGLRHAPDARPASSASGPRSASYGPRGPFREVIERVDVSYAIRGLAPAERQVLIEHYALGNRQPGRVRRQAIASLRELLERP